MKFEQILLCYINFFPGLGFSLIAPLFPPLFKDKNLSNQLCSYVISLSPLAEILCATYFPMVVKTIGRRRLFLSALIFESLCILFYGLIAKIKNNFIFLPLIIINRATHGFFNATVNILAFSFTSIINQGKELEEATAYMEFFNMFGLSLGPFIAGIFYEIGGYSLPFIVSSLFGAVRIIMFYYIPQVNNEKVDDDENESKSSYIPLLKDFNYLSLILSFLVVLNTLDFFIPTLSIYLKNRWDISTSNASYFFLLSGVSYTLAVLIIKYFTDFFGNFLLITLCLFLSAIFSLFIAPASFLPQHWIFVAIGIFFEGINQCFVNVPTFIELNNYSNIKFPGNEKIGGDIAATFFNMGYYVGDLFFPILGAFLNDKYSFQFSAYFAFALCLIYSIIFYLYHKNKMKNISFFNNSNINKNRIENKESSIILLEDRE